MAPSQFHLTEGNPNPNPNPNPIPDPNPDPNLTALSAPSDGRFPITLLSGISGSGKTVLADSICDLTSSRATYIVIRNKLSDGANWSPERVRQELEAAAAHFQCLSADQAKGHVLMLTPGHVSIPLVLKTLVTDAEITSK